MSTEPTRESPQVNPADDRMESSSRRSVGRAILIALAKITALACIGLVTFGLGFVAQGYFHYTHDLPSIESLKNYRPPLVTQVFADNGELIGEYCHERRYVVSMDEIPEMLRNAFVAAEDKNFWNHEPPSLWMFPRFFRQTIILTGRLRHHWAPIPCQVARSQQRRMCVRRLKGAIQSLILAYRLEKMLTRRQILHIYLNQIYLGSSAYGVESSARAYFGKHVKELSIAECAMIAGLAKGPTLYSPKRNLERALKRRAYVLGRMLDDGYIDKEQYDKAIMEKVRLVERPDYKSRPTAHFVEHVRRYIEGRYGADKLCSEGLKVYTTANLKLSAAAYQAVEKGMLELDERRPVDTSGNPGKDAEPAHEPEAALILKENGTGYVRALLWGRPGEGCSYNWATQAYIPAGSSFMPVIYAAAAIEKGFTAEDLIESWSTEGALRADPINHREIIGPKLLHDVGVDQVVACARKLGFRSEILRNSGIVTGSAKVTLEEQVDAYSVFANSGAFRPSVYVKKVVDRDGKTLEEHRAAAPWNSAASAPPTDPEPPEPSSVDSSSKAGRVGAQAQRMGIDKAVARAMTVLLRDAFIRGPGASFRDLPDLDHLAGLAAQTANNSDTWCIGFSPDYTCGVWVGIPGSQSLGGRETGATAAAPIWLDFMKEALRHKPDQNLVVSDSPAVEASQ